MSLKRIQSDKALQDAVRVLSRFDDDRITQQLLARYPELTASVRTQVVDVLFRRRGSARALLERISAGDIDKADVSIPQLRNVALHHDQELDRRVRELWGRVSPGTAEEKLAVMRRFNNDLRASGGEAVRGKPLFAKHCGTCHQLFGEGNRIGPDLTTANRHDRAALLANIVDPSAVIRREYVNYTLVTTDGRVVSGLLADQDAGSVTVLDAKNQKLRFRRGEIEEFGEAGVSLMPERLLEQLSPQELRDLFAYLQRK
jgi:putative heme-binding domain-containing protein